MPTRRPNIVLLCGEDTGRYFGCYGDPIAQTPNIDRLAAEGCRYDNAYSTFPVCSPSRSTIVTGQYPWTIGTHQHRSELLNPPRLFTHELRDSGYHVTWSSKLDFNFEPTEGWRDSDEPWLEKLAAGTMPNQPWFVYHNFSITHESCIWPDQPASPDQPSNQFRRGRPRPARSCDPADVPVPPYFPDTPVVREDIARHYDNIAEMDRGVGEVLDALEKSGEAENTLVMLLVDHGRGLPREKRWPYTAGLHMPLIVRGPGAKVGTTSDEMISWTDIAPTLLSLAGVPIPDAYVGRVFMGPGSQAGEGLVFGGRDRMDESFDYVRICRDKDYHYVRNFYPGIPTAQRNKYMEHMPTMVELRRLHAAGELAGDALVQMAWPRPSEELYVLADDPWCVKNVADDPAHAEAKARLAAALDAKLEATRDLGRVPERQLVEQGLVGDVLDWHRARVAPLPPEQQFGGISTVVECHEAEAIEA